MWQVEALHKVEKMKDIHKVVRLELLDAGLVKYTDGPKELSLTDKGNALLLHAASPDYASKRQ